MRVRISLLALGFLVGVKLTFSFCFCSPAEQKRGCLDPMWAQRLGPMWAQQFWDLLFDVTASPFAQYRFVIAAKKHACGYTCARATIHD